MRTDCSMGTPAERDAATDAAVMGLLLTESHGPFSVAEVAADLGDDLAAQDSLSRLVRVGLVHRLGGFVFASRAAVQADAIRA
jgi:hypothetical protein